MFGTTVTTFENTSAISSGVSSNRSSNTVVGDCGCEVQINDARKGLPISSVREVGLRLLQEDKQGKRVKAFDVLPIERALCSFCPEGWRVPTIAELECLYKNKEKIGGFSTDRLYYSANLQGYDILGFDFYKGKVEKFKLVGDKSQGDLRCVKNKW